MCWARPRELVTAQSSQIKLLTWAYLSWHIEYAHVVSGCIFLCHIVSNGAWRTSVLVACCYQCASRLIRWSHYNTVPRCAYEAIAHRSHDFVHLAHGDVPRDCFECHCCRFPAAFSKLSVYSLNQCLRITAGFSIYLATAQFPKECTWQLLLSATFVYIWSRISVIQISQGREKCLYVKFSTPQD